LGVLFFFFVFFLIGCWVMWGKGVDWGDTEGTSGPGSIDCAYSLHSGFFFFQSLSEEREKWREQMKNSEVGEEGNLVQTVGEAGWYNCTEK
jgi:hypothetical protein